MKKDDKASISLKKVISISIILLFVMGIGVMAASSKLNSVKIILSDGYEMDVLTSKTNISEILDENHIMLLPTEKVIPSLEEELSDNKTIKITFSKENSNTLEIASEDLSVENVLKDYNSITEKIIKEQVKVAYEIETKDLSTGNAEKTEKKAPRAGAWLCAGVRTYGFTYSFRRPPPPGSRPRLRRHGAAAHFGQQRHAGGSAGQAAGAGCHFGRPARQRFAGRHHHRGRSRPAAGAARAAPGRAAGLVQSPQPPDCPAETGTAGFCPAGLRQLRPAGRALHRAAGGAGGGKRPQLVLCAVPRTLCLRCPGQVPLPG